MIFRKANVITVQEEPDGEKIRKEGSVLDVGAGKKTEKYFMENQRSRVGTENSIHHMKLVERKKSSPIL